MFSTCCVCSPASFVTVQGPSSSSCTRPSLPTYSLSCTCPHPLPLSPYLILLLPSSRASHFLHLARCPPSSLGPLSSLTPIAISLLTPAARCPLHVHVPPSPPPLPSCHAGVRCIPLLLEGRCRHRNPTCPRDVSEICRHRDLTAGEDAARTGGRLEADPAPSAPPRLVPVTRRRAAQIASPPGARCILLLREGRCRRWNPGNMSEAIDIYRRWDLRTEEDTGRMGGHQEAGSDGPDATAARPGCRPEPAAVVPPPVNFFFLFYLLHTRN